MAELVEEEWLELVRDEVDELLLDTRASHRRRLGQRHVEPALALQIEPVAFPVGVTRRQVRHVDDLYAGVGDALAQGAQQRDAPGDGRLVEQVDAPLVLG